MRDPNRIPIILAALEARWRREPDLRLAQLICNQVDGGDPFYLDDGELLALLMRDEDTWAASAS